MPRADALFEEINPARLIVEAGNVFKPFTARRLIICRALHPDFFQRFQAIRYESRSDHEQALLAGLGQAFEFVVGVRGKPRFAGQT